MHIEKFKNSQCKAIIKHVKREHLHYKNENVDLSQSNHNVYFVNRQNDYIENRIKNDLYVYGGWNEKTKLKTNVMVDIVVNCPDSYDDPDRFFKIMNYELCKKFKKENVVCSVIHNDESTQHLHFCFIPVVFNDKKQKYQLSYEKCLAHEFKTFHKDIEDMVKIDFPNDNIILHNEDNKERFYFNNIEDYKKYKNSLNNLIKDVDDLEDYLKKLEDYANYKNNELDEIIKKIKSSKDELSNIFGSDSLDDVIKGYKDFEH